MARLPRIVTAKSRLMIVGLMKAKVSSCSHSVRPPNTITTVPVMISMGGSVRPFSSVQPMARATEPMKMPVAQKIAVSFETGPVSGAKFCMALKMITNARTGPRSVQMLPAPLGIDFFGSVGAVSVMGGHLAGWGAYGQTRCARRWMNCCVAWRAPATLKASAARI